MNKMSEKRVRWKEEATFSRNPTVRATAFQSVTVSDAAASQRLNKRIRSSTKNWHCRFSAEINCAWSSFIDSFIQIHSGSLSLSLSHSLSRQCKKSDSKNIHHSLPIGLLVVGNIFSSWNGSYAVTRTLCKDWCVLA